ncbi:MAG: MaoC family dehydratase N-terminal domain-containing protein, partial [Afipia sp.]|nr:MaoC family dehydratase N-terminal domain-containing protein [Afipia sp.]
MSQQLDIPHLRHWIGREDVVEDLLTPSLVARFHATLNGANDHVQPDAIAPRLIHFCLCQPALPMAGLGEDGHPSRGEFLPPVPLPRRMWAGSEIIFHGELRVGDTVRRRSRIADVTAKTGRSGVLCLVAIEHEIS